MRGGLREDVSLRIEAETLACLFFHADVNPRRRILPDSNKRESWLDASGLQGGDAFRSVRVELFRDDATVDEIRRH